MKVKYILLFIAVAASALLTACDTKTSTTASGSGSSAQFLRKTTPGMYEGAKALYSFTKTDNQLYVNTTTNTYRIVADDGMNYLQVALDSPVPGMGEKVHATITSKGIGEVKSYEGLEMEVMKKDNENCWLWSQAENLGLVLFYIP